MIIDVFVLAYLGGRADALGRRADAAERDRDRRSGRDCARGDRRHRSQGRRRPERYAQVNGAFGSPAQIGELFLSDHLLAFEVTSIVLLVAAVGGVILGSAMPTSDDEEEAA